MRTNNSPWLTQLHKDRETVSLIKDMQTDTVIIGGGIAGVTTLYFLLKHTDKRVVLLEGNKLAHGATGHNAGQVVAEFEKPLSEIVREHGIEKTISGVRMVEDAWGLLRDIWKETTIDVSLNEFVGAGGYCELEQLIADLETEHIKHIHGLASLPVLVSVESGWLEQVPEQYKPLCKNVSHQEILMQLDTINEDYHAIIQQHKGVVNSALFTERLALWCLKQYPDRCFVFEKSFVHGIELEAAQPVVITNDAKVFCENVVLCTNGFENFYIHDKEGFTIDTKFHHFVHGAVGYMTGFVMNHSEKHMANYYYEKGKKRSNDPFSSDPYFYVTKRNFDQEKGFARLMTIGGPEVRLENREIYHHDFEVKEDFQDASVRFGKENFDMSGVEHKFFWHGLMGYTTTGVRVVGVEPLDARLLYNLGCNGVGILPSVMGARKIARHIAGETVPESIFDPKDHVETL